MDWDRTKVKNIQKAYQRKRVRHRAEVEMLTDLNNRLTKELDAKEGHLQTVERLFLDACRELQDMREKYEPNG